MKIIIILIGIVITTIINYILFIPSSAVNLMIDVFVSHDNRVILIIDFAISNLIFWGIISALLKYSPKGNDKKDD
jgi:predicted ATP-grasp superfamily ATP-dependent carboligase